MKSWILGRAAKPLCLLAAASYLVIAVFLQTTPVTAAGATLYVDTNTSTATDSVLGANIRLNADNNNVSQVQFSLTYDASKLEFTNAESSGSPFSSPQASGANGSVNISAGSNTDKVNGDVVVTNLKFRILYHSGTTTLKFNNPRIYSSSNGEVSSLTSGATYDLGEPAIPTSNPTAANVTPTQAVVTKPGPPVPSTSRKVTPVPASPPSQPAATVLTETAPTVSPVRSDIEVPDHPSGSVFLRPGSTPSNRRKAAYWLWTVGALAVGAGILACAFMLRNSRLLRKSHAANAVTIPTEIVPDDSISDQFLPGSVVTWSDPKSQYEVIRPLASRSADSDLTVEGVQNLQVPLPHIPVAEVAASQPNVTVEETGTDWTYDINSPLMNTL